MGLKNEGIIEDKARELHEKTLEEIKKKKQQLKKQKKFDRANRSRTVSFVGALINVCKADRRPWDGIGGKAAKKMVGMLAAAVANSNPYTTALGILAGPMANSIDKPDVYGHVELHYRGNIAAVANLGVQNDSFTPQWNNVAWRQIDINEAYLRISLFDKDLLDNDSIGIFEIGSELLKEAAAKGQVLPVQVSEQTNGQVLFGLISVQ